MAPRPAALHSAKAEALYIERRWCASGLWTQEESPMTCPICGARGYSLSAAFCTRCGARTVAPEPPARPLSQGAAAIRPSDFRPRAFMVTKSAGVAVLRSFLWCGLGQIYNGNIGKGVLLMMVYPISIVVSWFGIFALIRAAPATGRSPAWWGSGLTTTPRWPTP